MNAVRKLAITSTQIKATVANRPENLELWSVSQPPGQRVEDKVRWAKEILALYGEMAGAA